MEKEYGEDLLDMVANRMEELLDGPPHRPDGWSREYLESELRSLVEHIRNEIANAALSWAAEIPPEKR